MKKFLVLIVFLFLYSCSGFNEQEMYRLMNIHCEGCKIYRSEVIKTQNNKIVGASLCAIKHDSSSVCIIYNYDTQADGYTIATITPLQEIVVKKNTVFVK